MNVFSLPDEMFASVLKYNSFEDLTAVCKVSSEINSVARRYGMDLMKADDLGMNVLSLPDEMLASVLKYNSFEDLTAVRKVSSKIDSVARRYGLDKLIVHDLGITTYNRKVEMWIQVLKPRKEYEIRWPLSADLLHILKYYFSKIRGVKQLRLENYGNVSMSISNEVGEFLLGNGCKNLTKLLMTDCDISINFKTMRRIMTKLKLEGLFIHGSFTEFQFSDAVIEGISFDRLVLMNRKETLKPMQLSLPYLTRLCALKIPSTLRCKVNNSTVSDLITLFKGWTKDMIHAVELWIIEISEGTMSVDETKQSLTKLKCFEYCRIEYKMKNAWDMASYQIRRRTKYCKTHIKINVFP